MEDKILCSQGQTGLSHSDLQGHRASHGKQAKLVFGTLPAPACSVPLRHRPVGAQCIVRQCIAFTKHFS